MRRAATVLLTLAATASLWFWTGNAPFGTALADQGAQTASAASTTPGFSVADDPNAPSFTDASNWGSGDSSLAPVAIDEAGEIYLSIYSDVGYHDEQGRYVVDLLEQDYAYLAVMVTTEDGRPVVGAEPRFASQGASQLLRPETVMSRSQTDASGTLDFAVIGGLMGLDTVTVSLGEAETELLVNVISLRAAGFPVLPKIEGGLSWRELMSADVRFGDQGMSVAFPDEVAQRSGSTVRLAGFMMPLEADLRQRRFLLTSNPPSCFFHIPGGPAGAVEVLTKKGIEASWDPLILEGRFETVSTADLGVIYRLTDARVVTP